ncbi:MAG: heavy metal-associated domain-containing protein [Candidatus Daviesbacteria bacterium]|nr:heavy metal-associated domain-containing protein [Candidatus Daviesbacteria bacterium]
MANLVKVKLKIDGMHCTSCAMCIDMDLEDLPGVCNCKTSYAKAETEVEYDPEKIDLEKITETIKKSGYTAISID